MHPVVGSYREFEPCDALKGHVRALFSFVPNAEGMPAGRRITCDVRFGAGGLFSAPVFADGHASMVFYLGRTCQVDGLWRPDPAGCHGKVIGAVSRVDPVRINAAEMIGAYFHAAQAPSFALVPAHELTDRMVAVEDLWGGEASGLSQQLAEMNEGARLDHLESLLLRRIAKRRTPSSAVNIPQLAASVFRWRGHVTVEQVAADAAVSRQHLTRLFREYIGISPKLYCRLARFQSGLVYAGCGKNVDWAQTALELGYADQSHMIAEFREFSSLTPQKLATERWFHPFIERAKSTA